MKWRKGDQDIRGTNSTPKTKAQTEKKDFAGNGHDAKAR